MPDASVDVSIVRDRFNFDWAMDPDNGVEEDTFWWWARSIRADPNEVIADDGEGNLYAIGFTYDEASDTVTFAAPERVRETFVPVQASVGASASVLISKRRQQVLAANLERPDKPDPQDLNPAASRSTNDQEVTTMAIDVAALRSRLQLTSEELPDDATEEQINAALTTEPEQPEPETPETEVEEPVTPEAEREPVAASDRVVNVDRGRFEQLEADAAAGRTARETQVSAERDALVEAAVQDGRIAPASRQAWREALDARPEAEASSLAALTKGRIPVDERGVAASEETNDQQGTGWFPQLQKEA